jgi:hypothetical protein
MKTIVGAKFRTDAPRDNIEILEALDDDADGRGISVGDDSKSKEGERLLGTHGTNSA